MGAAERLHAALKVSTKSRSSALLKTILGLNSDEKLPTPVKTVELLRSRPGYSEAQKEGMIPFVLGPLVDQRLFESLMEGSRHSHASGINHWIMSTEELGIPPENQLVPAQDAARWLATFSVQGTPAAYRTHLKYASTIARKPTGWATDADLVKRVIEGVGKEPDTLVVKPVKWTCRRSKAILM